MAFHNYPALQRILRMELRYAQHGRCAMQAAFAARESTRFAGFANKKHGMDNEGRTPSRPP
jgi:hypothetical protein